MAYKDRAKMIKAQNEWLAKNYDRINLVVPKGQKEVIQELAKAKGLSISGYINEAISEKMEREEDE